MELDEQNKAILVRMIHGEAWKVVLHVIGRRLASHEQILRAQIGDSASVMQILSRRNELLDFINRIYSEAQEENPFDEAAWALWCRKFPVPRADEEDVPPIENPFFPSRPSPGGSVA